MGKGFCRKKNMLLLKKIILFEFYKYRMEFEEFTIEFWKSISEKYGKTACLVGIRSDESLNRFRTISNQSKKLTGICAILQE
jgi:Predicted phosphoadenosine phosphosulfate sulfotransferase